MTTVRRPTVRRIKAAGESCNTDGCNTSVFVFEIDLHGLKFRVCKQCLTNITRQAKLAEQYGRSA